MARTLPPVAQAAFDASQVRFIVLVEMNFASGFLRMNNSAITINVGGNDWIGVGELGNISPIGEGISLESRGLSFSISGVPQANIAVALGQHYQGRDCKVWLLPLTEAHAPACDPVLVFFGRLDVMDVELGQTATITVTAESRMADWDRSRVRRYNAEDQLITDPTDKGFEFVPQMAEKELKWGY